MTERWPQKTLLANRRGAINDSEGLEQGRINQIRAYELFQEMARSGLLNRVTKSSGKQGRSGIEMFIHLDIDDEIVKVPVQIKSSASAAEKFRIEKARDIARKKIIVLVVNKHKTNNEIRDDILRNLRTHWHVDLK